MNLLLGGKALFSFLIGAKFQKGESEHEKFRQWAASQPSANSYFSSEMTVAALRASIEQIQNVSRREFIRQEVESKLVNGLGLNSLLRVDSPVLKQWSSLRAGLGAQTTVTCEQLVEVASALHYGYMYVTPVTDQILQIREDIPDLQIIDPWAS